nr:hypothetical protein HK105_003515 [Polyrhizophydium stewartii]
MQAIPGDNSENILAWRTVCHLLLARFILSEEITETPSKRGVDEARANVLQASQLSYESPTARYLFLQGLRVLISLSSKVVDLIEPRWSSVPAIKALVLLDNLVVPKGFEQRNFANKIAGKIDAAPKVRDAELFLIVMAEIMREALRRVENRGLFNQVGSGFDEIAETSQSGANLEIADAWEVVFVSSSFVIDACAADPSRKRLLAEASLSKGQSIAQGILIFSDRPEAYKRLETAAASFLSALEIGKTLSERWIVFNSAASLWNTFVAAEQCFAHSADPRRGDRPGEMWTEVFQKLADLLADTDICDSTLYSQICSTLGLSLVEAQAAQTADSLKSKGKPVGKDGATLLKAAEDMFKSGLGAKHADYNSLFVGAKGWCKLQSQRQPPAVSAQSLESDDPVLRLFVALETGQFAAAGATAAARQSKDADIAASEHAASALHHVKLMPDIFRAELFLRIARQSAELGSHGVALGCARSASAFLGRLEQYVEAGQAHYVEASPLVGLDLVSTSC